MSVLRLHQVVFGLGQGVLGASDNRMGLWTQGCSLPKCRGCTSMHTWSPTGGRLVAIASLLKLVGTQACPPQGLTVSGGEPTDQAAGLTAFIAGFRQRLPGAEVVLYTGLPWIRLTQRFPDLVALLDVAVAGPYVRTRAATALAGSSNQKVVLLTPLARRLYEGWQDWPRHRLQVGVVGGNQLLTLGIPDTSGMALAARQVDAVAVSWDKGAGEKRS